MEQKKSDLKYAGLAFNLYIYPNRRMKKISLPYNFNRLGLNEKIQPILDVLTQSFSNTKMNSNKP